MDAYQWKHDNRAPFNIIAAAWAKQLHALVHDGTLSIERAGTIMQDASSFTFDKIDAWTGPLTGKGVSQEDLLETAALNDGEEPADDDYTKANNTNVFAAPCFDSLAALMEMSVADLQKLTAKDDATRKPPTVGGETSQPDNQVQPTAAPPIPPTGKDDDFLDRASEATRPRS